MAELRRLYRPTASQRWARLAGKEAAHSALLLQLELPLEPMVVAADEAHAMNGRQNKHTKSLLKHLQVAEP